jgi:hypothetical protein
MVRAVLEGSDARKVDSQRSFWFHTCGVFPDREPVGVNGLYSWFSMTPLQGNDGSQLNCIKDRLCSAFLVRGSHIVENRVGQIQRALLPKSQSLTVKADMQDRACCRITGLGEPCEVAAFQSRSNPCGGLRAPLMVGDYWLYGPVIRRFQPDFECARNRNTALDVRHRSDIELPPILRSKFDHLTKQYTLFYYKYTTTKTKCGRMGSSPNHSLIRDQWSPFTSADRRGYFLTRRFQLLNTE